MFGLSHEDWNLLSRLVIEPLKSCGADVWVFGSRARGRSEKFSDIDILYEAKVKLPDGFIYTILSNAEESPLPIKVDLVERRNLAESYLESIEIEKIRI